MIYLTILGVMIRMCKSDVKIEQYLLIYIHNGGQ